MKRRTFLFGTAAIPAIAALDSAFNVASASTPSGSIKQGGKMKITYQADPGTLDPAIGYNWENWSMIYALFSRLLGYKPGTAELTIDAAQSWSVSKDGKTYTFILRPNLKFYDGTPITAHDVKYSLERVINPETKSPGQSFYDSIVGYAPAAQGKKKHVDGIKVLGDHKMEIHLSEPNAVFPNILAMDFSGIVDRARVEKYGDNFGHNPGGSGAFYVAQYSPGHSIKWRRNKHYFKEHLPYLDEVDFELGLSPLTAFFQLLRGQNDLLGDGIPGSQLARVKSSPRLNKLMVKGIQLETSYITMNTQMPPFDDVKVRRALNMAIDKKHVVAVFNGKARPTNQILPPHMPGYDPSYEGYSYDPEKARQLLEEAGYQKGFDTELYAMNTPPQPKIAQALQADLKKVGVRAKLRLLSQAQVVAVAGTPHKAPLVWSGGLGWQEDFPDPWDFYGPILSCGSAIMGGWNWAFYCNKKIDAQVKKADGLYQPSQRNARIKMFKQIFKDIMKDAPWVPVFNKVKYTMHSSNIAGAVDGVFDDIGIFPYNFAYFYNTTIQD